MPSRTFSSNDVDNFNLGIFQAPSNTLDFVVSGTGFNNISATVSEGAGPSAGPIAIVSYVLLTITGNFNFQNFPAIPVTARIFNVKLRYIASISGSGSAFHDAPPAGTSCVAQTEGGLVDNSGSPYTYKEIPNISDVDLDDISAAISHSVSETLTTSLQEYSFPAGLTYIEFVSFFQDIEILFDCGVAASTTAGANSTLGDNGTLSFTSIELLVTYTDFPISWVLENQATPVKKGQLVTITGTFNEENGDIPLTDVEQIIFTYDPGTGDQECIVSSIEFYFQSPTELSFYIPFCLGSFAGVATITVVGSGTFFSGSISLGTLTIFFEDTSGIYKIIKGKTTDTVYDPSRDGTTDEIKIQNPFGSTGYVDG